MVTPEQLCIGSGCSFNEGIDSLPPLFPRKILRDISGKGAFVTLTVVVVLRLVFPGGSMVKISLANARNSGDVAPVPWLARSSGEGYGNPIQYSRLENSMDRGVW